MWLATEPCACSCTYGGHSFKPHPVPDWLTSFWAVIAPLLPAVEGGRPPNAISGNLYHGDSDSVGWHADNGPLFDATNAHATIVSVSLGASRKFQVKCGQGTVRTVVLDSGDLLAMHGLVQKHFKHRVPPGTAGSSSPRVNLTLRWVKCHEAADGCPLAEARLSRATQACTAGVEPSHAGSPWVPVAGGEPDADTCLHTRAAGHKVSLGKTVRLKSGGFVGHDMAIKADNVLRVLTFQGQSRVAAPEPVSAARRMGEYLALVGADLALISETGLRDDSPHLNSFATTLRGEFGFLAINHFPRDAPNGKGVLILTRLEHPPRAKSVKRDTLARGLAATIAFKPVGPASPGGGGRAGIDLRVQAGYGVTGLTAASGPSSPDSDALAKWLTADLRAAAAAGLPVVLGLDCNSVRDEHLDSIGTMASARKDGLVTRMLDAGMQCTFRIHFPRLRVGTRLCPSGANFLVRTLVLPCPSFLPAAVGLHWHHQMPSDHSPVLADFVGVCAVQMLRLHAPTTALGVTTLVPWRQFLDIVKESREASSGRNKDSFATFRANLEAVVSETENEWTSIERAARALPASPEDPPLARAQLGALTRRLVQSVNRAVCKLVPRSRSKLATQQQKSKLARSWTVARAAIQAATTALCSDRPDPWKVFQQLLSAAKAWRAATAAHSRKFPEANIGSLAKRRVNPPKGSSETALRKWLRSNRLLIMESKESWGIVAKRLHRQELASSSRSALQARRAAHRAGDTRQWLHHLVGPPLPLFPAAIEAPTADTPAARASAGAEVLHQKYGVRRWDASRDSQVVFCSIDSAGRRRGWLRAPHEVSAAHTAAAEAAWNFGADPADFGDPARPLDSNEQSSLWEAFPGAPGGSHFKLSVVPCFGPAAQAATVALINAMLRSGLIPAWLKRALLLWMSKPNGGLRGISLLEELLKAVEAVVTRRLEESIHAHPPGRVLSESNVGFQKGRGSTLVLDVLADFWDEARQYPQRKLAHVPWDYVGFFDRIDTAVPDAILKARGVPDSAACLLVEAHSTNATLSALTPWGPTPPVTRKVGSHQGGCSAPFQSRGAGEIVARLVDQHKHPVSIGNVPVAQMSYADDGNGFGEGDASGQSIGDALGEGCVQTGLGIDCKQGGGFTTGPPTSIEIRHIGEDGRPCSVDLALSPLTSPFHTLGVSSDWMPGQAGSVAQLDRRIKLELGLCKMRRCDVFELHSVVTLFVHSLLVYAPNAQCVGVSQAAEWDALIATAAKHALGVHPTASSDLLYAPSQAGGLGFHTCVAQILANSARELLISFEGTERQAQVRRGRWEVLIKKPNGTAQQQASSLVERINYLATKGWYLRDARELFQSRVAAKLAQQGPGWGHGGYGRQCKGGDAARAKYASTGPLCAAIRSGFSRSPAEADAISATWWGSLSGVRWADVPATPQDVSDAVAAALEEARQDWYSERRFFRCSPCTPQEAHLPWWEQENWRSDLADQCPRAAALAKHPSLPAQSSWAASDGGDRDEIVTSAYVFSDTSEPVDPHSSPCRPATGYRQQARLPSHVGTRKCGVHEGELSALLGVVAAAPLARLPSLQWIALRSLTWLTACLAEREVTL